MCLKFLVFTFSLPLIYFAYSHSPSSESDLLLVTQRGDFYSTNTKKCPLGSYFYRDAQPVECICSKGLWVFYQKACGNPTFMQGSANRTCTNIDFQVKKSIRISEDISPSLSVLHPTDGVVMKLFQNSLSSPFKLNEKELILVSGEWSLELQDGRTMCVGSAEKFCLYEGEPISDVKVEYTVKGCHQHFADKSKTLRMTPVQCTKFAQSESEHEKHCQNKRRVKRVPPKGQPAGRAFIPTNVAMNADFKKKFEENATGWNETYPPPDEDMGNITRDGNPLIKSQIWNYYTERATEVLELYDNERNVVKNQLAAFQFLEVCRDLFGIRCPSHYVSKDHIDLSMYTFRAIQIRDMLYEEPPVSHDEVDRILKVLNYCKNQTNGSFPFTKTVKVCNESDRKPAGVLVTESPLETIGLFREFDEDNMLDIPSKWSPGAREPIIETIWNIFVHAHSYCYKHFEDSAFNDHHKFTTIMMTLFQNGILDIWKEVVELKPDIYGGFLGDAVVLMQRVVHCAAAARIDNETTYPWDLVRPGNKSDGSPQTKEACEAAGLTWSEAELSCAPKVRRKRSVVEFQLPREQSDQGCLSSINSNSFVCTE